MWLKEGYNPYDPAVSLRSQTYIYGRAADRVRRGLGALCLPVALNDFFGPFGLLPYY